MIDVLIYESEADKKEDRAAEEWQDVPCAPRVGETVFLHRELGKKNSPIYRVVSVEWYRPRKDQRGLHAYVVVEAESAQAGGDE